MANTELSVVDTSQHTYPELLDSRWVAQHLNGCNNDLVEAGEDVPFYETRYIPGAATLDWHRDVPVLSDRAHSLRMWTPAMAGGFEL
jgi:3-mercaptopyruvate sulfurtransferase SseA